MKSSYLWIAGMLTLLIAGCNDDKHNPYGSNGTYGLMDNEREFGVIVSTSVGDHLVVNNAGSAASGVAASSAGAAASSAIGGGMLSPISGAFSSAGNLFYSGSTPATTQNESEITYVIKKDSGQQITIKQVPEINETISYPGQRVMIQKNGNYVRIYPANEENPLDPNQDTSSYPHR